MKAGMKLTASIYQDEDGVYIAECPSIPGSRRLTLGVPDRWPMDLGATQRLLGRGMSVIMYACKPSSRRLVVMKDCAVLRTPGIAG